MTTGNQDTQTIEAPKPAEANPDASADPTGEEVLRLLDQANAGHVAADEKRDIQQGKDKKAAPEVEADPRDKIAKGHRERRKAEMRGEATDINDPALRNSAHADGEGKPASETQQTAETQTEQQQQAAAPVKREVELIVDGKSTKVMLTDEEIMTAAKATLQKNTTADYRLQNATKLMNEANQRLAAMDGSRTAPPTNADDAARADEGGAVPTKKASDAPTDPKADADRKARLTDIATKLQVGSTEEAVEALGELVKAVAPQQPVDIDQHVQGAIRRERDITQSTEAMTTKFAQTHGEAFSVKNDPDGVASFAFESVVIREMIKDMQAAGYSNEVLDHYGLRRDKEALKVAHAALRINGNSGIRTVSDILDTASKDETFKKYAKTGQIQPKVEVNRQDRKDGLPQQPAQRGAPPASPQKAAEETRQSGMSAAIAKMKASRGQLGATN